ncbi:hypothetical protein [Vagococcus fluvialis]|uniref:hypothetical protein n=1 Tax=Vagococcus fluvialis TaxID=2738 RepID=UPI002034265A|nr:hypothetical protein [Vagococcus fluvialis]MCM2138660.1 hypothetical protein [Vagococcus fluvialis]MDT2780352.1 hypothetical protein [Vagococcus fluvialis]WNF90978.1 hypothetical protein QDW48_04500 [Vagococcus fluvialis]
MKLSTAFNYRFKVQLKNYGIGLGVYTIITLVFPLINFFRGITYSSPATDILFMTACVVLGGSLAIINMDFKLFIQNGMSRNNIFISYLLSIVSISALVTFFVLSLQELAKHFLPNHIRFSIFLSDIYSPNNVFLAFFILFLLFNLVGSLGLLIGTFNIRFGNTVKFIALGFLIASPSLVGATLYYSGPSIRSSLLSLLKLALGISKDYFNPLNLIVTMFTLTLLLVVTSFLMIRKAEIKRVNT